MKQKSKTKLVSVRLTGYELEVMDAVCEQYNMNRSDMIRIGLWMLISHYSENDKSLLFIDRVIEKVKQTTIENINSIVQNQLDIALSQRGL